WSAFLVPAKTPREVVAKIHADTVKALAEPAVKQKLEAGGAVIKGSTPAELAAFLNAELDKWGRGIKAANIRPEEARTKAQGVPFDCPPKAPVFSRYEWPRWLIAVASTAACSSAGTTSAISSAALSTMRATRSSTSTGSSFSRCALTSSLIWQCRHSAMGIASFRRRRFFG